MAFVTYDELYQTSGEWADAFGISGPDHPSSTAADSPRDAFRHAFSNAMLVFNTRDSLDPVLDAQGANTVVKTLGTVFEIISRSNYMNNKEGNLFGISDANMDLWNNAKGREVGLHANSESDIAYRVKAMLDNGELITNPMASGVPAYTDWGLANIELYGHSVAAIRSAVDKSLITLDTNFSDALDSFSKILSLSSESGAKLLSGKISDLGAIQFIGLNASQQVASIHSVYSTTYLSEVVSRLGWTQADGSVNWEVFAGSAPQNAGLGESLSLDGGFLLSQPGDLLRFLTPGQAEALRAGTLSTDTPLLSPDDLFGSVGQDVLIGGVERDLLPVQSTLNADGSRSIVALSPQGAWVTQTLPASGAAYTESVSYPSSLGITTTATYDAAGIPSAFTLAFPNWGIYKVAA